MKCKNRLQKKNHDDDAYCEIGSLFSGYLQIQRKSHSLVFSFADVEFSQAHGQLTSTYLFIEIASSYKSCNIFYCEGQLIKFPPQDLLPAQVPRHPLMQLRMIHLLVLHCEKGCEPTFLAYMLPPLNCIFKQGQGCGRALFCVAS